MDEYSSKHRREIKVQMIMLMTFSMVRIYGDTGLLEHTNIEVIIITKIHIFGILFSIFPSLLWLSSRSEPCTPMNSSILSVAGFVKLTMFLWCGRVQKIK